MDSARLFLCARCRTQVVLCSGCDRGNRYCGRACSRQARDVARREAASRYQRSHRGRAAHAQRTRCWRERAAVRDEGDDSEPENVTHQGCPGGQDAAPLAAWTQDSTIASTNIAAEVLAPQEGAITAPGHCRRCAVVLPGWLRQGFVRHAVRPAAAARRHDHLA